MAALRSLKRIRGPLQLLLLLLLPRDLVVTGQDVEVTQRPEKISVKAGEDLFLKCTLTGRNIPGGMRWYKGKDRSQTPIYSDKQGASNRGIRVIAGSNTDFSINIQNVRPEDAGIYYCVKFRAGNPEKELVSGNGTLVSVIAKPSHPVVLGPTGRITAGSRASFNCSTGGFFPQEIMISWLKDGKKISAGQTNILNSDEKQSISYRAENTMEIPLERGDMKSHLTCQIQHSSLDGPLEQTFALGDVLRIPPKVHLKINPPSPVQLNASVTVTCSAESFYPDGMKVELFAEDAQARKGSVKTSNPDGTFTFKSYLEMTATEDRNFSRFLCQVPMLYSGAVINSTTRLFITRQLEDLDAKSANSQQQSILVLCLALFLSKAAVLLLISCLFLIKRHGCKRAKDPSGTSQEVRQSGTSS